MRSLPVSSSGLPIELVPVLLQQEQTGQLDQPRSRRKRKSLSSDFRQLKVREFLDQQALELSSRRIYEITLQDWLDWCELPWHEVKPRHVGEYKQYLLKERKQKKNTVNRAIAILKAFFDWFSALNPAMMSTSPAASVKLERIDLPPADDLSSEQMAKVWDALYSYPQFGLRDIALVHVLSHGLRASEVVSLSVAAFDGQLLFLAKTKNHESRKVPLRAEAAQAVADYLRYRAEEGETVEYSSPLFLSHTPRQAGQRLTYQGVYYFVKQLAKVTGIADLHPHAFRHTYATELLRQGLDPAHARRLSGHKSEQVFRRYTQSVEQDAAIAAFYRTIGQSGESVANPVVSNLLSNDAIVNSEED